MGLREAFIRVHSLWWKENIFQCDGYLKTVQFPLLLLLTQKQHHCAIITAYLFPVHIIYYLPSCSSWLRAPHLVSLGLLFNCFPPGTSAAHPGSVALAILTSPLELMVPRIIVPYQGPAELCGAIVLIEVRCGSMVAHPCSISACCYLLSPLWKSGVFIRSIKDRYGKRCPWASPSLT